MLPIFVLNKLLNLSTSFVYLEIADQIAVNKHQETLASQLKDKLLEREQVYSMIRCLMSYEILTIHSRVIESIISRSRTQLVE